MFIHFPWLCESEPDGKWMDGKYQQHRPEISPKSSELGSPDVPKATALSCRMAATLVAATCCQWSQMVWGNQTGKTWVKTGGLQRSKQVDFTRWTSTSPFFVGPKNQRWLADDFHFWSEGQQETSLVTSFYSQIWGCSENSLINPSQQIWKAWMKLL